MNPFLTVVTRCYKRPQALKVNQASLRSQSDPDYEQVLLVDEIGRGIEWAHTNMATACPRIHGDYVLVLDDDDQIVVDTLIAELKEAARSDPDLIMLRMQIVPGFVVPEDDHFRAPPVVGHIGMSCFAVKRDLWVANVQHFEPVYQGDFTFIDAVYPQARSIIYLDRVMTATQDGNHHGQPESIDPSA
jgi:glycosyltransferase involved in cell wall biosynthesis